MAGFLGNELFSIEMIYFPVEDDSFPRGKRLIPRRKLQVSVGMVNSIFLVAYGRHDALSSRNHLIPRGK